MLRVKNERVGARKMIDFRMLIERLPESEWIFLMPDTGIWCQENNRFWHAFSHEKIHTPVTCRSGSYPKTFRMACAIWYVF